jgi:hypothetical protein
MMLVSVDNGVFAAATNLPAVLGLLDLFAEEKHEWLCGVDTSELASQYLESHTPTLAQALTLLVEQAAVASMYPAGAVGRSVSAETLKDDLHDLRLPAVVVVEDMVADQGFVCCISAVLGRDLHPLVELGWLKFVHAGGKGRMLAVAQQEIAVFRRQARVVAILDSDSLIPRQATQSHVIASHLRNVGVSTHIFERREAENYLPNRVLATAKATRKLSQKLAALNELSSDQRAHYDLKFGFQIAKGRISVPPVQTQLFTALSESTLLRLVGGFGKDVIALLGAALPRLSEQDFASLGPSVVVELRSMLGLIEGEM